MSSVVIAFDGRRLQQRPWLNHELAELYRAVDMLGRAGLTVDTDMGMSDEGDPWFAFCRADTGDVLVHCARIGGLFVASSVAIAQTFRGANFRDVIDSIVRYQPLSIPMAESNTRLLLHPAAVLTAFIATALLFTHRADAAELHHAVQLAMPEDHGSLKGLAAIKAAVADLFNALTGHGDVKTNTAPQTEPEAPISLAALMSAALNIVTPSIKTTLAETPAVDAAATLAAWHGDGSSHFSPFSVLSAISQESFSIQPGDASVDSSADSAAWGWVKSMAPQAPTGMTIFQVTADAATPVTAHSAALLGTLDHSFGNGTAGPQIDHTIIHPLRDQAAASSSGNSGSDVVPQTTLQAATSASHFDTADLGVIQSDALTVLLGVSSATVQSDVVVSVVHSLQTSPSGTVVNGHSATVSLTVQGGGDTSASVPVVVAPPTDTGSTATTGTGTAGDTTHVAPPSTPTGPTTIILSADPTTGLADLVSYALSDHPLSGTPIASAALNLGLTIYAAETDAPVKLVVFDSNDINLPFFLFVKGVVFVDDHELGLNPSQANLDAAMTVDMVSGGVMKLLGVVDASHLALS